MEVSKRKRSVLGVIAVCAAVLALIMAMAGAAQAEERHFCYGANVAANGGGCGSGTWRMNSSYANSPNGPVCLQLLAGSNYYSCMHNANEGVYINQGFCGTGSTAILNWNPYSVKVYGVFWTC